MGIRKLRRSVAKANGTFESRRKRLERLIREAKAELEAKAARDAAADKPATEGA